jgi:EIN3-binding F-box protein
LQEHKPSELSPKKADVISSEAEMNPADDDLEIECNGYLTRSVDDKKATDLRLAAIAVGTSGRGGLGFLIW